MSHCAVTEWWLKTPDKTPNYSFCLDKAKRCRTSKVLMDNDCNQGKINTVTCRSHTIGMCVCYY